VTIQTKYLTFYARCVIEAFNVNAHAENVCKQGVRNNYNHCCIMSQNSLQQRVSIQSDFNLRSITCTDQDLNVCFWKHFRDKNIQSTHTLTKNTDLHIIYVAAVKFTLKYLVSKHWWRRVPAGVRKDIHPVRKLVPLFSPQGSLWSR